MYFVNNINMILDAILLILTLLSLHIIKANHSNFLFFPRGAALFLPPEDTLENRPKKKKQQKPQNQISVLKVEYQHVKDYPFSNEFSRVILTTTGLAIFFILRIIASLFYKGESMLPFYTVCLLLVYTAKLGVDTFFMTNYGRKNCLLVALGLNATFIVFFELLGNNEGVFDQNLKMVTQDWVKHLEIIFNRRVNFITHKALLYLVFIINFFLIIIAIPTIIKFGNWYAKTLKEIYYDSEGEASLPPARKLGSQQGDIKEQQRRLKERSKQIILKLNIYLTSTLFLLFLSHPFICQYLQESIVFGLRAICLIACVLSICLTMDSAIEFNGSFAYRYVLQFFQTDDSDKRAELRKKIAPYIYYIWYHLFQLIIRIVIPVLLFLVVLNWRYIAHQKAILPIAAERTFNPDIQCAIGSSQLEQLSNLYRCEMDSHQGLQEKMHLNGILWSIPASLDSNRVQANIQKYSLITRGVMVQFWQQLFWYSSLSTYLMTVAYVLLLRKTVYDI